MLWCWSLLLLMLLWSAGAGAAGLSGSATDARGVRSVTWACPTCTPPQDTAVCPACGTDAPDVTWQTGPIGLSVGPNVITVTAHNGTDATGTDQMTVTLIPEGQEPLPTVLALGACPRRGNRVTCTLTWESAATDVATWVLEQCRNQGGACPFAPIQSFDGGTRTATVANLLRNQSQCWRVRPEGGVGGAAVSNTVCR